VRRTPLFQRLETAFLWIAAFCLACGVFLSLTLLFKHLPPTEPVAVGAVTILRYAKSRDYLGAALFLLLVPPLTIWLRNLLARYALRPVILFALPYFFVPLFYLTTGKIGWILLLPIALSIALPKLFVFARTHRWIRELFRRELRPYHALVFTEGLSWILFRYLVATKRIAHYPTLFLEGVFVALFLALFWVAAINAARLAELLFARDPAQIFKRVAIGGLPLIALPFIAVASPPIMVPRLIVTALALLGAVIAWRVKTPASPRAAWKLAAYVIVPALIYLVSFASTAQLSQWIDLFHRGESVGPASDYLRGKVPFRDVFVLHGMLEDGQLDAWLMQLFGRSIDVAIWRTVIVGAFLGVSIWFLGIAVFESIPLALVCVAMGAWTTAENNRTFFQVAAVALFWNALRRRSSVSAVFSGVFAGVALFFSYEIGLYTIVGALAASLLLWVASKRVEWTGLAPSKAAGFFLLGVGIGALPFVIHLAKDGALDDFAVTSFITIPRIIDAVWSLPFPDLVSTFRKDLNLHTLADFVLWEKFHLILSPLVIAVAAVYFIARWLKRRTDMLDWALLVLTVFAAIAQRSAFGRASFRHQYFAAFLIGPMLVLLAVVLIRNLRTVWRDGGEGTRAFLGALAVAAVPLLGVLFWIPDLINARLDDLIGYNARILKVERNPHAEEVAWRIADVSKAIGSLTRPNEPIFDFSNQPAFYFFANRPNPTRFYQVPILSPREFQAETIAALEKARPKVILRRSPEQFDQFDGVTNDLRAQAVSAYIDETYRFDRAHLGVELWTRRRDARPRPVAEYLKLIRLPDAKELVSSGLQRMVFPAVGSLAGIHGSYWQSDLTMHNPLRVPIRLRLRYVAGQISVDRQIALQPRQTLRLPDVVRTFFRAEGAVGTLWIEHRENLAPVAVVKTSDVAHNARASVEQPLTRRDAATAQTESAELAIVGVSASSVEGRRVNVGIVNIGTIPATFRIDVRDRTGRVIGTPVESGVPEDQVWFVSGIEDQVKVKLDETMTVRITVIAGTGVGFATVVEPGGDSEFIAAIPAQQQ
jgi:hypothetical protein